MNLQLTGDGKGFEVRVKGTWRSVMALIAAMVLVCSAPGFTQLAALLGWW